MKITQLVTGPLSVNTWFIPLDSMRVVVVDPGGDADSIIAHLASLDAVPVCFLLTHGHFDHLIALPALARRWPEAAVAIHAADSQFLGALALERHYQFFADIGGGALIKRYRDELPPATVMLEDGEGISFARLPEGTIPGWIVLHTPGHSPGSVCLYNALEKILISGDTLFNSGFGRTDVEGGSMEDLQRSLTRLFSLPGETQVLPGHGPVTTIAQETGMY